jgi:putative SOS response-associated peptidase YedK
MVPDSSFYVPEKSMTLGDLVLEVLSENKDWNPRYNVAPTQSVPVIRQHPKEPRRDLSLIRWGLIPSRANRHGGSGTTRSAKLAAITNSNTERFHSEFLPTLT